MSEILIAIGAAILIPVLSAMWSRRTKGNTEAAGQSLVFGLVILAAAILCFYFGLSFPATENELLGMFLVILKILLFVAGVFGAMAGAAIVWESYKGFSNRTKRG